MNELTKREYFAAIILQGLLAKNPFTGNMHLPEDAVELADLLLIELNKEKDEKIH